MAIKTKEVNVGDKDYRIGHLSPENQMKNLYLIQRHDNSGAFMALMLFGFKTPSQSNKEKEKEVHHFDPDKSFNQLVQTLMSHMQKTMSYEEWQGFISTMLSKVFKIDSEKNEPVSVRDFQGEMKNMLLLVAHSMRHQYSDFFCLNDQT